ncbi:FlgB family protein [Cognatiyoonia sp. IB215446]|uniref:FlgB family protein n=1 Tax=Cognatiyoonia sp. IB215446 TaxID=3097355 RepID=UPI002A152087|nr:FlgB family protein [Cognatiyoonia sp. IB215446]MDX8346422.1 FlgB family protein [Cognatiyoonia sp. IB215446]
MYQSLDLFQTAHAMARHAGARQALVAQNIANADTPRYEARHIPPFQDVFEASGDMQMRATRAGHLSAGGTVGANAAALTATTEPSPNGNTVSLEEEMMNSVAISREHNRALTIYRHTMAVLRTSLGRS